MKTGRYKLKDLFDNKEIDQIIIPEIQRDYVWTKYNVKGLLNSIFSHYEEKVDLELDITCQGNDITEEERAFLTEEYRRLRFNTRIGFIYAYKDDSYNGKLFLIDGQQRMTTLYLLLLALYSKNDKKSFREMYFKEGLPTIDYKVRETSHDFMVDFINHQLSGDSTSFKSSPKYYTIYDLDVTAKSILSNYEVIVDYIKEKKLSATKLNDFKDYVENYIEFNYFDTNISSQGERLYLYMNSRGEDLSRQESLKAMLIERSDNKLEDGKMWEDWQDFFWQNRGNNVNADKGFFEFIKEAIIIFLIINDKNSDECEKLISIPLMSSKEEVEEQLRIVKNFIGNTSTFNIVWLKEVFNAIHLLHSMNCESDGYIREGWLSRVQYSIDYVTILGCTYYLIVNSTSDELSVRRIGMYLKNICFYTTNRNDPSGTVINALKSIKKMSENSINDIADVNTERIGLNVRFMNDNDKERNKLYRTSLRDEWEQVFWGIINADENKFNTFIRGNQSILIKLCETEEVTPKDLNRTYLTFKEKIYLQREGVLGTNLRRKLLEYGDFSIDDDGYGNGMERWNLIEDDNDWYNLLSKEDSKREIIKKYLLNEEPDIVRGGWCDVLANPVYGCLEYMSQRKFLWQESKEGHQHIILLHGHNFSRGNDNSQELTIKILNSLIEGSWVYIYTTCVVEFNIENGEVKIGSENDQNYYIDIVYNWNDQNSTWTLKLGHRVKDIEKDLADKLNSETNESWTFIEGKDDSRSIILNKDVIKESEDDTWDTSARKAAKLVKRELEIICRII